MAVLLNAVFIFFCSLIPLAFTMSASKVATFKMFRDYELSDGGSLTAVTHSGRHMTLVTCSGECLGAGWDVCKAVNFQEDRRSCVLLSEQRSATNTVVQTAGTTYLEASIAPQSCLDWNRVYGSTVSGSHVIDPDGPYTGLDPFPVYCDFQENPPVAKIYHNKASVTVDGYEPNASFQTDVVYELSMAQMLSVINASTSCKQYLKVRCIGTYFFGSLTEAGHNIYWSSRDGERMLYWGGGNPNGWGCACALDNTCVSSNLGLCNCNTNDGNWREDEGYVTDTSKLPVSQLHGGDTGSSSEEIHFTVGPLECVL